MMPPLVKQAPGAEIEEIRILSINLENVYVIQAKDDYALLEVECEITFEAKVTYEDY